MGSQHLQPNTVLTLDLSDIRKEYAQKMEYLAMVRDGSRGELHQGCWLCDFSAAEVNGSEVVPLCQKLYSAEAQDFHSENDEVLTAVDLVRSHTPSHMQGRPLLPLQGREPSDWRKYWPYSFYDFRGRTWYPKIAGSGPSLTRRLGIGSRTRPNMSYTVSRKTRSAS